MITPRLLSILELAEELWRRMSRLKTTRSRCDCSTLSPCDLCIIEEIIEKARQLEEARRA